MNHTALLQSSFQIDCPPSSDSDYIGPQRVFSGSGAFPTEEDEQHRRVGCLGHSLAPPVSVPVTNGFRYSAQHDVPFSASPGLLMSPVDSCSGSSSTSPISASSLAYASLANVFPGNVTSAEGFPPTSASAYSHSGEYQWNERMSDFRSSHRVPALVSPTICSQPPSGSSPSLQQQGTAVPASSTFVGRGDSYSAYTLNRSSFPSPHSTLSELSRYSQYTTTPRALENPVDRSPNTMYSRAGSMLLEPTQRSTQTTADAPPFYETDILHSIVTKNQTIKPEIQAKIHKGFFQVDEKWTCYRRNYFSVSCSFSLRPWTANVPLYVQLPNHTTEHIRSFSMSISAIVNAQEGEIRELVQHTPKRDKQSEKRPGKITIQPQQPPSLVLNHGSAASSNHLAFGAPTHSAGLTMDFTSSYTNAPQTPQPPAQHTFERIQFQKATANNGKRRAQQQYYNLVVELYAEITSPVGSDPDAQWIKIARRLSHPMVVRGRSPGHYKDGRRDSSTSMGPDGGTGSSGDGSGGTVLPPGLGQATRSHSSLMSYDPSQRGGSHYGRNDYRQMTSTDHSPLSDSPLMSSSSSSAFEFTILNDTMDPMEAMKNASNVDTYHDPAFAMTSADCRKPESHFRNQLPIFDYDSSSRDHEEHENTFGESFDSLISLLQKDQEDSSQPLKRSARLMTYHNRQPSATGYDSGHSSRQHDTSYGRFDPIQGSQSLCT